jgi:hypothetical protein
MIWTVWLAAVRLAVLGVVAGGKALTAQTNEGSKDLVSYNFVGRRPESIGRLPLRTTARCGDAPPFFLAVLPVERLPQPSQTPSLCCTRPDR